MGQHLEGSKHAIKLESGLLETMHIGRNGHVNFWCGFCNKLISTKEDLQAYETRLKHIGDHYDKHDCNIGDWVCIEENRPRRSIVKGDKKRAELRSRRNGASLAQLEGDSDLGEDGIPLEVSPAPGYMATDLTYLSSKHVQENLVGEDDDAEGGSNANNVVW